MIKLINRGFRKLSEFFKGNKELSDKCRKCKVVKPGGISPAIVLLKEILVMKIVTITVV